MFMGESYLFDRGLQAQSIYRFRYTMLPHASSQFQVKSSSLLEACTEGERGGRGGLGRKIIIQPCGAQEEGR